MDAAAPRVHEEFTATHAVPAQPFELGFRLLALRQVHAVGAPPAFAVIDQHILRRPERLSRHAVFFASTFLPEIMAWLGQHLGRPSQRDTADRAVRNPRWPTLAWRREERTWPDGTSTTEWLVEVAFQDEASWTAFRQRWAARLEGKSDLPALQPG
jgi:hypothetical protein